MALVDLAGCGKPESALARRMAPWRFASILAAALIPLAAPSGSRAGPPYVTDDPQPTDLGHWEIYSFVTAAETPGDLSGETGVDLNYGGAKNLQLTAVIPVAFENGNRFGAGDVELAAKYKLVHQQDGGWVPDIAVFPRVFLPTGTRFAPSRPGLFLPVWVEKDFGPWSVFGGGGLFINPGGGERDFWQSGLVVSRSFGKRLTLGLEAYHQTPQDFASKDFTGVNVGATYQLTPHWALMAAGGPGVQNAREAGRYAFYAALLATY
jgi:hypothetical protein